MNTRINYRWKENYFVENSAEGFDSIVTDGIYDFEDWIKDSISRAYNGNFAVEREGDIYYIIDGCNERTGEMYVVIGEEKTEEELEG